MRRMSFGPFFFFLSVPGKCMNRVVNGFESVWRSSLMATKENSLLLLNPLKSTPCALPSTRRFPHMYKKNSSSGRCVYVYVCRSLLCLSTPKCFNGIEKSLWKRLDRILLRSLPPMIRNAVES